MCSVRVIGESDIMQEFLSESDEVCISCIIVVAMRLFILGVEILWVELSFPTKLLGLVTF